MIGFLLRLIPFAGPVVTLASFLPRLLHLKHEKAVHREAGEPFPENYQAEIDAHTVRTQVAGWRLAAGIMTMTTLGTGFLWYGANLKIDDYKAIAENNEEARKVAMKERDTWYKSYTEQNAELVGLRARVSEESIKRQGLIAVDVKKRTVARKGRLDVEKKLPASSIDPADWMRVESVAGGDAATPAPAISDPASVPTGAG